MTSVRLGFRLFSALPIKMNADFSIERLGASAHRKWLSITVISFGLSVAGLRMTMSRPDVHPLVFASCVSWLVALIVSGVARDGLMRMDPMRLRIADWECEGRVYAAVGVPAFRWLLLHTPLGWLAPTIKLASCRGGIERLLREMNYAEGVHWIGGIITLGLAGGSAAAGHGVVGIWLLLSTVPMHVYPVMVQRSNRGRALRVLRSICSPANSVRPDSPRSGADRNVTVPKIAEPDGAANGSQPIRSETNRTSSAAGSRR